MQGQTDVFVLHLFSTDNITHITYVQQISSDIHNRQQYACSHWAEKHSTEYYSHDVCRNINSTQDLLNAQPDKFYHYFASANIILEDKDFYLSNIKKTIMLTSSSADINQQLTAFHCLYTDKKENELIKSLLWLEQMAHSEGRHLPKTNAMSTPKFFLTEKLK